MSTKKLGVLLVAIGTFGIIFSLIVDFIGFGDGGIQAAQILGILTGVLITIFGWSIVTQIPEKQIDIGKNLQYILIRILNLQTGVWFVIGFLIAYILFFINPVFLNSDRTMVYFNRYLPNINPIGADMNYTLSHVKSWVTTREPPYPTSYYPPLTYVLLSPLTLFEYPISYEVSIFLTILSFIFLSIIIPLLFGSKKDLSLILFLAVTGLFSYGFQFELERAQYYSMAFLLCMLAIYIFHEHYEFRYLAYLLFSFSVHLKIAPIFFLPMFIKNWRDWRGNIKRFTYLAILNIILLFVLGYKNLVDFVNILFDTITKPTFLWNGNHSLSNFVYNFSNDGFGLLPDKAVLVLKQNATQFERLLQLIIIVCVVSIIIHTYRKRSHSFNPYLLMVCTICTLVIPVSVDYTLPMLVAPLAILLGNVSRLNGSTVNKLVSILIIFAVSISYTSLLFPFKYKPYFLNNSFPALFLILIAGTLLYFLQGEFSPNKLIKNEQFSE